MKTLKASDFNISTIGKVTKSLLITGVAASSMMLGSCVSDPASCTDSDTGSLRDPASNGTTCVDSD